jgi:succinate dehydrogenase / fumarate reductase cytochrome b subunit
MAGNSYYYRKLHSLLGIVPIGFFLVEHLLSNYTAFNEGHLGFIKQVNWLNSLPLVLFLEIFFIWIPLLYHGVYGLYVAYTAKYNNGNLGYFRNHMFMLQRVTGVITFIFVAWHFFELRFQVALGNVKHEELGMTMHAIATNPVYYVLYLIGIVAAVFHFSNGIWNFLVSWGITIGPRAQRVSSYICMGIFVVMSIMFILSLTAFLDPSFQEMPAMNG